MHASVPLFRFRIACRIQNETPERTRLEPRLRTREKDARGLVCGMRIARRCSQCASEAAAFGWMEVGRSRRRSTRQKTLCCSMGARASAAVTTPGSRRIATTSTSTGATRRALARAARANIICPRCMVPCLAFWHGTVCSRSARPSRASTPHKHVVCARRATNAGAIIQYAAWRSEEVGAPLS